MGMWNKKAEQLRPTCPVLSTAEKPHLGEYIVQTMSYTAAVAVHTLTERSPELLCPLVDEEPPPGMVSKVGSKAQTLQRNAYLVRGPHCSQKCGKRKSSLPSQSKD